MRFAPIVPAGNNLAELNGLHVHLAVAAGLERRRLYRLHSAGTGLGGQDQVLPAVVLLGRGSVHSLIAHTVRGAGLEALGAVASSVAAQVQRVAVRQLVTTAAAVGIVAAELQHAALRRDGLPENIVGACIGWWQGAGVSWVRACLVFADRSMAWVNTTRLETLTLAGARRFAVRSCIATPSALCIARAGGCSGGCTCQNNGQAKANTLDCGRCHVDC